MFSTVWELALFLNGLKCEGFAEDHAKAQLLWGKIHSQPEHLKLICSEQSCTNLFGGAALLKTR